MNISKYEFECKKPSTAFTKKILKHKTRKWFFPINNNNNLLINLCEILL